MCVSTDLSSEGMYPSLFLSALSSQSDRTLSLCWEQHCKLLPGVQGIQAKQVAGWSVDEVRRKVSVKQPTLHRLLCFRSSGLCRTLSAVRIKRVSLKMRWENVSFGKNAYFKRQCFNLCVLVLFTWDLKRENSFNFFSFLDRQTYYFFHQFVRSTKNISKLKK